MSKNSAFPEIRITYPDWVESAVDFDADYPDDASRIRLALEVARENVMRGSGGPFGAAILEVNGGRLVAVGMNLVVPANNSTLHAEIVAFMMAEARVGSYTLAAPGLPQHELFTSCEPCAMCLGAVLWSGVRRVVWAATREDANALSFDEGPVFASSYKYLRRRGIKFDAGLLRDEGQAVLELYREADGTIYNG
ncbi:MAG: nucleoside deaminase [Longimicrobiales bacterium]